MRKSPQETKLPAGGKFQVTGDMVRVGGAEIPTHTIRHATVERRSPPNRGISYFLIALGPVAGLAIFLATGWVVASALIGLGIVIVGAALFRDDGQHEVVAHMHDGDAKAIYRTRQRRKAEQLAAALGRSAALTDLSIEHVMADETR